MEVLMRLKPKVRPYIVMIVVLAVLVIVIALALAAAFSEYSYPVMLVALLVLLLCVLMVMQQLYRKWYTTYEITEHDVLWRFGVFAPDEHVIPINQITNMKVDRSFLGIIFGFADLQLDTASAKMDYEIIMKDLDAGELDKLVELLRCLRGDRPQRSKSKEPDQEQTNL
ncbi:PH domain-containing protein [Candidatus Micrarchaeota archaeon]|nr:PH domain-containing protein [Candidatus Micrarchaeota archaeon]